jgi:hypothetical protein
VSALAWVLVGAVAWLIIGFAVALILGHVFAYRNAMRPTKRPVTRTDDPEVPRTARGA